MTLRPYQEDAVRALSNNNCGIVAAATGSGKTTMMAASILEKAKEGRVLVVVHLQQLVIQTKKRIEDETGIETGMYYGEHKDDILTSKVIVATWQSLSMLTEKSLIPKDTFYSINVDEAHHVTGQQYFEMIDYFDAEFLHGYTATPYGPRQEMIFDLLGNIIFSIDIFDLIEQGFLSKLEMKVYKSGIKNLNPDLIGGYHKDKDCYIQEMEETLVEEGRVPKIVHFFKKNDHIKEFRESVSKENTADYSSHVKRKVRGGILDDFNEEAGSINHIYSIRMLNEGIDIPIINGLVFHEHAGNFRTFTQRLGRGLRVYKNPEDRTYISQFLDFSDVDTVSSVSSFEEEVKRALSERKESDKDYTDFVKITLDKETEEFLEEYREKSLENEEYQRKSITSCGKCGEVFFALNRMISFLKPSDKLICGTCSPGGSVQSFCAKCGDEVFLKPAKYRLNVNHSTKFYCDTHRHKHGGDITLNCDYCGSSFYMKSGVYNGKVKNGQETFYCGAECRAKSKIRIATCSECNESFEMTVKAYNNKIRNGTKFYCIEHNKYHRKSKGLTQKTRTVDSSNKLKCAVCGNDEMVSDRTIKMYTDKNNRFLCQNHKYEKRGNMVSCYNCGDDIEVTPQRYNEYSKRGVNFHCPECKGILKR